MDKAHDGPACILTGTEGENPDDCTTHEHEGRPTDLFGNDLTKTDSFGTPRERPVVACTICGDPTPMLGTKLCDRCWELKTRIEADPKLARKILAGVDQ